MYGDDEDMDYEQQDDDIEEIDQQMDVAGAEDGNEITSELWQVILQNFPLPSKLTV